MISFGLAGLVKGVVGLGLPTVSLGILSLFNDLPTVMVLLTAIFLHEYLAGARRWWFLAVGLAAMAVFAGGNSDGACWWCLVHTDRCGVS